MNAGSADPKPQPSADALSFDIPCRRCGYDLRGLDPAGRCPECNAPAVFAHQPDILAYADPEWLRVVVRGQCWTAIAFVTMTVPGLALLLAWFLPEFALKPFILAPAVVLWLIAGAASTFTGVWLILTPHPAERGRSLDWTNPRLVARSALLATALSVPLSWSLLEMLSLRDALIMQALLGPGGVAGLIGLVSISRYVEQVADRCIVFEEFTKAPQPDSFFGSIGLAPSLVAERAESYRKVYLVAWPICALGVLVNQFASVVPLAIISGIAAVFVLTFGMLIFLLPGYIAELIEIQYAFAQRAWDSAEQGDPRAALEVSSEAGDDEAGSSLREQL